MYLVYLLACNVCWKQYVGQTVNRFMSHLNNYNENNWKVGKGLEQKQASLLLEN